MAFEAVCSVRLSPVGGDRDGAWQVLAAVLADAGIAAVLFLPVAREPLQKASSASEGQGSVELKKRKPASLSPSSWMSERVAGMEHQAARGVIRERADRVIFLAALPAEGERHQHAAPVSRDVLLALSG